METFWFGFIRWERGENAQYIYAVFVGRWLERWWLQQKHVSLFIVDEDRWRWELACNENIIIYIYVYIYFKSTLNEEDPCRQMMGGKKAFHPCAWYSYTCKRTEAQPLPPHAKNIKWQDECRWRIFHDAAFVSRLGRSPRGFGGKTPRSDPLNNWGYVGGFFSYLSADSGVVFFSGSRSPGSRSSSS